MYLLSVPSVSSRYFNKIKQTSYLGKLPALSLEILSRANPVQFCNRVKVAQLPIYRSVYGSLGGDSLFKHSIKVMADYVSPRM